MKWHLRRWATDRRTIAVEDQDGAIVVTLKGWQEPIQEKARLIAAAPEMRALLETTLIYYSNDPYADDITDMITSLLNKIDTEKTIKTEWVTT